MTVGPQVVITGGGGQLSKDLAQMFDASKTLVLSHGELDISQAEAVDSAMLHYRPDVIINAAAWTDVDGCESNEEKARLIKISEEGPLEIKKLKAAGEELNVQISLAQKMLFRNQTLSKKGMVSESAVDKADERLLVLNAQINLVEEEIKLEEVRLQNDIRRQDAKVEKAAANILEEETQLSYATSTAPIDGVVAFVSTQEGETVVASMSAPTFVTLIDLKKIEVTAFVDETDIGKIRERKKVKSTVEA